MNLLKTIILSSVVAVSMGFEYRDLMALKDCHLNDSCERTNVTSYSTRNCMCDDLCPSYADCCLDSEYYFVDEYYKNNIGKYSCVNLMKQVREPRQVYMKATCMDDWDDPVISNLCLKGSPESSIGQEDPVANVPATSMESSITYVNYYCAICNQDSTSLYMWNIGWECEDSKDYKQNLNKTYILSNLIYKNYTWGVNINTNSGENFIGCTIYPLIPERLQSVVRNCSEMTHDCSSDWTDEDVKHLCQSYTSVVRNNGKNYRNIHCAMCNYENENDTDCFNPEYDTPFFRVLRPGLGSFSSFAVLFDFADPSGSNIVGSISKCEKTDIWDPFFRKCRSVICGKPNQVFRFDRCVDDGSDFNDILSTDPSVTSSSISSTAAGSLEGSTDKNMQILFPTSTKASIVFPDDTLFTSSPDNMSTLTITGTAVASNSTSELQKCHKIFLYNNEFTVSENGTVYVQNYSKVFTPQEYQLGMGGIFVCAQIPNTDKFSPIMAWVSLVGMGVSCVCLLLHLIAFLMVPDLRNLSGKNLASLCLALLASYTTFIVNMFSDPNAVDCIGLAAAMYFFFLSSFCWMNATAFDIWHTFSLTKKELRITAGNQWHKFMAYSIYSWLLPAIAVIIVVIIDVEQPVGIPEDFLPALGKRWCWFGHRKALLVFFALPMTILIVLNCVFFISTARIIAETTLATATNTTSSHHKNQYKMHMRLAVLMGFTWLSGTVAGYLQVEALWYVFVVLNTLQGPLIFMAFTCRRKVWRVMGVASQRMLHRGASWIAQKVGHTTQAIELKNSTTPSTSIDGL